MEHQSININTVCTWEVSVSISLLLLSVYCNLFTLNISDINFDEMGQVSSLDLEHMIQNLGQVEPIAGINIRFILFKWF